MKTETAVSEPALTLRILFVMPGQPDGPSMIFAKRQVAAVEQAGVHGRTFYLASRTSPMVLVRAWGALRQEIRTFKPDLVHAHYGTMTAFLSACATCTPLVVTYRGSDLIPDPDVSRLRWRVGTVLSQLAALRARRIVCVSNEVRGSLWWRAGRATVIPSGVDAQRFSPCPRDLARSELGWDREGYVVLFNTTGAPLRKRLDLARAAVEVARSLCGGIRFVVIDGNVEHSQMPLWMNGADCLVFTSDYEGSPNVVKEAIACNLPVVSVDVGDVRERLAGVHPSRIVGRDPAEIGRALAEILRSGQRSNGRDAVAAITLEATTDRVLDVYRDAVRHGTAFAQF